MDYLESNPDLPVQLSEELKIIYNRLQESDKNNAFSDRSKVQQLGGLHVIGTERHDSRRIDNQLRGRSGRQGDPGSSRFFLSLDDKLLRIFGGDKISDLMQNIGLQESVPIQSKFLNQSLESAQKKVEAYYFDIRKNLFEYDQALNTQTFTGAFGPAPSLGQPLPRRVRSRNACPPSRPKGEGIGV